MILPPYFWPIVAVLGGILLAILLVVVAMEWVARAVRAVVQPAVEAALDEVSREIDGRHNQTQLLTGI